MTNPYSTPLTGPGYRIGAIQICNLSHGTKPPRGVDPNKFTFVGLREAL